MSLPADFFIAGGTLRAQAPSYVLRLADQELFEHTLAGEFCYVLTPRQMGKSSLMIRTARRLAEAGRTVAILDLTGIGSGSADQWYLGLLEQIARDLRLKIDVPNWWQARASLAIPQRFSEFLRDVVLQEVVSPVVIFIDEIDSTLNFDFRDDFFAAIRAIYNARATESPYKRLTFALLGVATPTDLIHDRERTPFNIGRRIVLQEFSYDEAAPLKAGLEACHPGQGDVILRRIFFWTNGYPYLTQKLCLAAAERPAAHWDAAQVDDLVETTFFSDAGRKDPNFKFVQQRIQESSVAERRQMLNLYRKVYGGKSVPDDDRSQNQNHLELYGLVRVERGKLNVRNNTYQRIFDQKWIEANMPANRDLRLAIGASIAALLVIVAVWLIIRQTPSPSASLYVKQFNDNAFPTARIEALAGLFQLQDGPYDRDDEQGLSLFYNLGPYDQLDLFSQANARSRAMVPAIRRISLTLDEQDANDLAIMGEMITALRMAGGAGSDTLIKELTNWKSGRELAGKGQYQDATMAYSETIRLNADNLAARYDRASALIQLASYVAALEDLNQIVVIAKTAAPPPTAVPTATFTPTSVLAATSAPLASSAAGIPNETALSITAVPTITATSAITSTSQAGTRTSRFISTELIIKTVVTTVQGNEDLMSYLRNPQNHTTANQELRVTLGLSPIAQEVTQLTLTPGSDSIRNLRVNVLSSKEVELTVDYTYASDQGDNVWIGAQPSENSQWFGYRPQKMVRGDGTATIIVTFLPNNSLPDTTTSDMEVYMYIGGQSIFYSQQFAYPLTWSLGQTAIPTNTPLPLVLKILSASGTFTDELAFQVIANDPNVGPGDGAGISNVIFRFLDSRGRNLYERTERNAGYCAFGGGDAQKCDVWRFSEHNNQWPNGTPVVNGGIYRLQVIVEATSGQQLSPPDLTFTIQL